MPDNFYDVEILIRHTRVGMLTVMAATPDEAKALAGSQIRLQVSKNYNYKKGANDATKEGEQSEDDLQEHKGIAPLGEASEAGSRHRHE